MGHEYVIETKGYDYPFEKIKPLISSADYVLTNLKDPLTDMKISPLENEKGHIYKGDLSKTIGVLKRYGVKAVSLGNNHAMDYGSKALQNTFHALESAGIKFFGAGVDRTHAAKSRRKKFEVGKHTLPVRFHGGFWYRERYSKVYRFYAGKTRVGVNKLTNERIETQIEKIRSKHAKDLVIGYPSFGPNYMWVDEEQRSMAYAYIDAGADMVVGHGVQRIQEFELYKGKWIIYNLGNFVFISPGFYDKHKALPYSLLAMLEATSSGKDVTMKMKLYPIFCNNLISGWQSRHATKNEGKIIFEEILRKSNQPDVLKEKVKLGSDKYGPYYELEVGTWNADDGYAGPN